MDLRTLQLLVLVCLIVITGCGPATVSSVGPTTLPLLTETPQSLQTTRTPQLPLPTARLDTAFVSPVFPSPPIPPQGREELIVFAGRNKQTSSIGLLTSDGQKRRYLTDAGGNDLLPQWSPDGQYIAYLSDRQVPVGEHNQDYDLWLFDLAAERLTRLTRKGLVAYGSSFTAFVWSPGGDKILYETMPGVKTVDLKDKSIETVGEHLTIPFAWSDQGNIAITDIFTGERAALSLAILDSNYVSHFPHVEGYTVGGLYGLYTATSLAWQPNGELLAIGSYTSGRGDWNLKLVKVVKDKVVTQASLVEKFNIIDYGDVTDIAWSSDGMKLAFRLILRLEDEQIYVTNNELTELLALTPTDKLCNYPQWSPDSTRLVVSCRTGDGNSDLWLVNADGSNLHPLTNTPTISEETPMWQPVAHHQ